MKTEDNLITYIVEFNNDEHVIVHTNTVACERIENALLNMSAYYTSLQYTGYMDGHHFVINKVINNDTGDILSQNEVDDMYYHAFGPECISIRLDEDEEFTKYMEGFYK